MQTPAERSLIDGLIDHLESLPQPPALLNIGAGTSTTVEEEIESAGIRFVCDRLDVRDCGSQHPAIRTAYVASVDSMPLPDSTYDVAFANYVLEHVEDIGAAAREIARVLKPGGRFIVSTPNPRAPEFRLSGSTPFWFHEYILDRFIHGAHPHETHYAYQSIAALSRMFCDAGLELVASDYHAETYCYLHRVPLVGSVSKAYDSLVMRSGARTLMGNVCLTFEKRA